MTLIIIFLVKYTQILDSSIQTYQVTKIKMADDTQELHCYKKTSIQDNREIITRTCVVKNMEIPNQQE